MYFSISVIVFISAFLASSAYAVQCKQGDLTRSVDVVYTNPGQSVPCEVVYEKPDEGGGLQTLWRAENELGYCEARLSEFVERLESLGFNCAPASEPANNPASNPTESGTEQ